MQHADTSTTDLDAPRANAETPAPLHRPNPTAVMAAIGRRSFAAVASTSPAGHPHAAGVLYELVGSDLFVSTLRSSRKARNVDACGRVGVTIPIRRLPIGPPSTVQFQARAEVLDIDDPVMAAHVSDGHLRSVTGHGELELPGGCFLRISVPSRLHTYGLGMSLWSLIKDPMGAGGVVERGTR